MLSWVTKAAQSTLASVAGTAEPIYGPQALQSVAVQEDANPTYAITPEDVEWQLLESTCAETETFYIEATSGHFIMIQVIYSNVANLHINAQCNVKVFFPDGRIHWSARTLENYGFDERKRSFAADDFSLILSDDGTSYKITSQLDPETLVDVTITRTVAGFKIGKDGKTNFGEDLKNPWGCIRHIFWPQAKSEGSITVKGEKFAVDGIAIFIIALQGMKPHHAAAKWNFITFHSDNVTAVMMEFTTPPSYGSQTVNVANIYKNGQLVSGTTKGTVKHTKTVLDPVTGWEKPLALTANWNGKSLDGKVVVDGILEVADAKSIDLVDIMAEVPQIIKKFVAGAVGTRPFLYQYRQPATLKLKIGDEVTEEKGIMFSEATFIS